MKWLVRVFVIIWLLFGGASLVNYFSSWPGWSWDWNTLGSIATWFLVGGIGLVFWQIIEARRSTHAQVAVDLFRELRSEKTLEVLRFIYSLKPEEEVQNLPTIDKHNLDYVLDRLEMLGALVAEGIIDERLAIEAYGGPPVLKCWYKLRRYIKSVRNGRGLFCKYVEDFARRTVTYQIKHAPKSEWIHFLKEIPVKRDEDKINLIETLKGELLSPCEQLWAMFIRSLRAICDWCLKPVHKLCEKICRGTLKLAAREKSENKSKGVR